MENMEPLKYFALLEEFETANKLIRLGLGELQNINLDNNFYFLPFQLLSQGFERFMKAYICVGHFEKTNTLPTYEYLKRPGHDLVKLLTEIKDNYFVISGFPIHIKKDWDFLDNDKNLKKSLYILSEFGKIARYYNFNFITGYTKTGIDPKVHWHDFENIIKPIDGEEFNKLLNRDVDREVYYETNQKIIIIFEKLLSSLSRQIILNTLGLTGKRLISSSFYDYGLLSDNDYGKTDYRMVTARYVNTPKSIHKRSIFDKFNRRFNPDFKSKKISKKEFDGDWPFYVDEVIIECRQKHWCIVTINGYDYALNGAAKGRYKLENPHDAGMAVLGKSISDFIKLALDLG